MISCKKNESKSIVKDESEKKVTATSKKNENYSFVLSCGSGCAITYIPEEIQQNGEIINVRFKVETYINEEFSDTFYKKYNFIYGSSGEIEKINSEGKSENILQNLMPDAVAEFQKFSQFLLNNKNVDTSGFSKQKPVDTIKICTLPFNFDHYYNVCIENDKGCENRYPSYSYTENKSVLESYGIKEQPSFFFLLPKINNFQPIILAFTESDIEGYFLKIINGKRVVSSLQIGKMDGQAIDDFIITENYLIKIYGRKDIGDKRILKKKYNIQKDGKIEPYN